MTYRKIFVSLFALGGAIGCATIAPAQSGSAPLPSRSAPALLTPAPAAQPGETAACEVMREYMALFVKGDSKALAAFFAEDGILYGLDGTIKTGRDMKLQTAKSENKEAHMEFLNHSFVGSGATCWTEIVAGRKAGGPKALGGATRITVNSAGKIVEFITYVSPPPTVPKW